MGRAIEVRRLSRELRDDFWAVHTRVHAYPKVGDGLPAGEVWTGPVRLFEAAGFRRVGGSDEAPVLETEP